MQLFDDDGWRTVFYNGEHFPEYEAHPSGRVRRPVGARSRQGLSPGKEIVPNAVNPYGYSAVQLYKDGRRVSALIHRVIASTFMEDYNPEWEVHHIDHNPTNNALDNLCCCPDWLHEAIHQEMLKIHKVVMASVVRLSKMRES